MKTSQTIIWGHLEMLVRGGEQQFCKWPIAVQLTHESLAARQRGPPSKDVSENATSAVAVQRAGALPTPDSGVRRGG